ncbi:MAG: isoaspartyl peptidase [Flavipsychrobacter sp.]|nr:isoaspartyl peptidase [Flavipsychrobacter sp.]
MSFTLVIHGGAGNITPAIMNEELEKEYSAALKGALDSGHEVLSKGGAAMDAVVAAIVSMENCPLFNAGRGSVFTKKGLNEMDAALMNGSNLMAGSIAGVRNIRNPIVLAREVMIHSGHVFLAGEGAAEFALSHGIEMVPDEYFFNQDRYDQWLEIRHTNFTQLDHKGDNLKSHLPDTGDYKFGTVGAAACDVQGNIAAGTSTGGMTNKRFGRIGDSPVIGAGTYANNATCAISCTGHGEPFLRACVAHDVSCLMEYKGLSLKAACDTVIKDKLIKIGGEGGLIAVDAKGNYEFCFNSNGMYRGMKNSEGKEVVAYYGE